MGVWGLPGTFPTGKVLEQIKKSDPQGLASDWSRKKVNDAHIWYNEAMEKGVPPWTQQTRQSANYISENTNISLADANMFGFAVYTLAQNGEIENLYYTGQLPENSYSLPFIPDPATVLKLTRTIKWVALAGAIGVGVYFAWPLLAQGRKTLKKRLQHG